MLERATRFIFDDGHATTEDLDRVIDESGWPLDSPPEHTLLAWRSGSHRDNFVRLRLAERLAVAAMPVRFDLERERPVLGFVGPIRPVEANLELIETPHLAAPLQHCSYLNMSSGTSLRRTIAFPSEANLIANADSCVERFELGPDQWYWCTFPFFAHAHELYAKPIQAGTPVIALPPTAIQKINQLLKTEVKQLHILTTPHVATSFLAKHLDIEDRSRVRFELAGEYVSPGVVRRLKQRGFRVAVSWGSAETSGVAVADLDPTVARSIGSPLPGYQVLPQQLTQRSTLKIAGPAVPPFLFLNNILQSTNGRFESRDEVAHDGQRILFLGRNDSQLKFKGTYINISQVEGWAKSFDEVDNAFLSLFEGQDETELRLAIQCPDRSHWQEIDAFVRQQMFKTYGGIRLRIHLHTQLAHTPTGKLIRQP